MRAAAQANLNKQRSGKKSWTAAVDADISLVMAKIQQLANDPREPNERGPNVRELMNAMQDLRTTTSRLAAVADDSEQQQLAGLSA